MAIDVTQNNITKLRVSDLPMWLNMLRATGQAGMVHGVPGCGKTASIKQYAKDHGMKFVLIMLSMCDPSDIKGIPAVVKINWKVKEIDPETGEETVKDYSRTGTEFMPPAMFPNVPSVICFDEVNQGTPAVMSASQSFVLERMVGTYKVPKDSIIVATGNRLTDKTGVMALPSAFDNRLIHCEIEPEVADFKDYLWKKYTTGMPRTEAGSLDYEAMTPHQLHTMECVQALLSYFEWQTDVHHKFNPALPRMGVHGQPTWRTWEMQLVHQLKAKEVGCPEHILDSIVCGAVGMSVGVDYNDFRRTYRELEASHPKLYMAKDNSKWVMPTDFSVLFAFISALPQHMSFKRNTEKGKHSAARMAELIKRFESSDRIGQEIVLVLLRAIYMAHKAECILFKEVVQAVSKYSKYLNV